MKADFTSIIYIIICLLILGITGLSRRRKKAIPPIPGMQGNMESDSGVYKGDTSGVSGETISDPFDSLERIFTQSNLVTSMEGESLETLVDEEAEYLKEKDTAIETTSKTDVHLPEDLTKQQALIKLLREEEQREQVDLFKDADELKKAVIYSEILRRRDF